MTDTLPNIEHRKFRSQISQLALQTILNEAPELYVVTALPLIELPFIGETSDRKPIPINHHRVQSFIANFVYETTGEVLTGEQIRSIQRVLEGVAWHRNNREVQLETAIDQEPLLEALMILIEDPDTDMPHVRSAKALKDELDQIAETAGLDTTPPQWPKNASRLSRVLIGTGMKPYLSAAGIAVRRCTRTGRSRSLCIDRLDGDGNDASGTLPSPIPSSPNPLVDHTIEKNDTSDATNPVFDRIRKGTQSNVE